MVRAVLEKGRIRPLSPLPDDWSEGQKLLIQVEAESPEEIAAWAQEIEAAARAIPDEDHIRFLEALDEQKRFSKELVRKQMRL